MSGKSLLDGWNAVLARPPWTRDLWRRGFRRCRGLRLQLQADGAVAIAPVRGGGNHEFEFGPLAMKAIRERMIEDGHSRGYINDSIARIKRMFEWGAAEQLAHPETYQSLALVGGLRRGKKNGGS